MKTKTQITILLALALQGGMASVFAEKETTDARLAELESKVSQLEESAGQSMRGHWKNAFVFEQPDKAFRLQVGTRVQLDAAFFSADDALDEANGPFDDGVKFRRAYLNLRGNIYDNMDFVIEYDFANSLGFRNLYGGVSKVPVVGNIRVGHLLEPMGLEELTSNNFITFMERGFPNAFNPVYNTGIMVFDTALDQRMTWAAGIFKDTGNFGESVSNEEFAVTARLTGMPYLNEENRRYVHLGYSVSMRNLKPEDGYRVRARPDSFIAPLVVDTKAIPADQVNLVGIESIVTLGSFSLQGEWSMASADRVDAETGSSLSDVDFSGYYLMVSYLLTGEYRPYLKNSGTTGRIIPRQNATGKSWGLGAWEVAARYNGIDLTDSGINGGDMTTATLGLNWYLNPNSRIMWNYVMADVEDTGDVDVFQMRFQIDF